MTKSTTKLTLPKPIRNNLYQIGRMIDHHGDGEIEDLVWKHYAEFMKGKFICPKCHGDSTIPKEKELIDPMSGWPYKTETIDVPCDLCGGKGWTEKELKPVMGVVGYK